jgi:hypothetical protein
MRLARFADAFRCFSPQLCTTGVLTLFNVELLNFFLEFLNCSLKFSTLGLVWHGIFNNCDACSHFADILVHKLDLFETPAEANKETNQVKKSQHELEKRLMQSNSHVSILLGRSFSLDTSQHQLTRVIQKGSLAVN